jgi:hypothetical protein
LPWARFSAAYFKIDLKSLKKEIAEMLSKPFCFQLNDCCESGNSHDSIRMYLSNSADAILLSKRSMLRIVHSYNSSYLFLFRQFLLLCFLYKLDEVQHFLRLPRTSLTSVAHEKLCAAHKVNLFRFSDYKC